MPRLLPLLLSLCLLQAAAAELDAACAGAPPPPAAPDPDFHHLRRADPSAAWAWACAHRGEGDLGRLRVAEALVERRQIEPARALLDTLEAQPLPPPLRGRVLFARGQILVDRADSVQALPLLKAAAQAIGPATDSVAALVHLYLSDAYWRRLGPGDLARASAQLDQAEALLAAAGRGDSLMQLELEYGRSFIAATGNDVAAALRWNERLETRMQALGRAETTEMLAVLANAAGMLAQLGRLDEALATAERGAALAARLPSAMPENRRTIALAFVHILLRLGRPAEALPYAEQALALMRQSRPGSSNVVLSLTWRGEVLTALQRWAEARRDFEEAQAIAAAIPEGVGPARWLPLAVGHAKVLVLLGEPEAARALIESTLARQDSGPQTYRFSYGRLLQQRAALAARAGDWAAADQHLAATETAMAGLAGVYDLLPVEASRCIAQRQGGLPGDACARLRQRLAEADTLPAYLRFQLFNALAQAAVGDEALPWHLRALAAAEDVAGPDPRWAALDALARHWRAEGRRTLAVLAGKQAVLQVEAMRADLGAEAQRLERGFLADKLGVYRRLADWLAEDGRVAEAVQVLRLLQHEEFHEFAQRDASVSGARGPVAASELLTLREERAWRPWLHVPAPAPTAPGNPPQAQAQAQTQEARVQAWLAELAQSAVPGPAAAGWPEAAPRPAPPAGVLDVTLFPGERQLHLLLSGAAGSEALALPLPAGAAARRVGELLARLSQQAPAAELAPLLAAWQADLGAPLQAAARRHGARQLRLNLFGALRYLPLAALDDGHGPLGQHLALVQQIDEPGGILPATGAARVQVLAVTRGGAGLPELPALAQEVCDIVRGPVAGGSAPCRHGALPGQAWLNERFTREQLASAAASPGLLHVGTHFSLRPGHMGRSWLLLGSGEKLTLDELARLDFAGQRLVTLSACETGLGGAEREGSEGREGSEVEGLNRLILRRGAAAVLASLWRVDDRSTAALMAAFYRGLARGLAPARALQQAQAALRAQPKWAHPYHWAGFYLAAR